jgi:hypothetical protein
MQVWDRWGSVRGLKWLKAFIRRAFEVLERSRSHNGDRSKRYKGIKNIDIRIAYRGIAGAG